MRDDCGIIDVEVRNLSRVTKIKQLRKTYTKSQLNMRLKVVLDQERKDTDPFDGQEEFISFDTDCKWIVNDTTILNRFVATNVTYSIDVPITHDVFQGTERNGEYRHVYEPSKDLLTELTSRSIASVTVSIKEPLMLSFREFDELLSTGRLQLKNHLQTFASRSLSGRQLEIRSYTLHDGSVIYSCGCEFDRVLMKIILGYDEFVRHEEGIINGDFALFYPWRIEMMKGK